MNHFTSAIDLKDPDQAGFSQIFVLGKGGTKEAIHHAKMAAGTCKSSGQGPMLSPEVVRIWMYFLYAYKPYAQVYWLAMKVLDEA
jgi:hypothetical protein